MNSRAVLGGYHDAAHKGGRVWRLSVTGTTAVHRRDDGTVHLSSTLPTVTLSTRPDDYLTTSHVPGHAQPQDDDVLHSYTLGKAIETVDWDEVEETIEHDGEEHRVYLLAVVYTSG